MVTAADAASYPAKAETAKPLRLAGLLQEPEIGFEPMTSCLQENERPCVSPVFMGVSGLGTVSYSGGTAIRRKVPTTSASGQQSGCAARPLRQRGTGDTTDRWQVSSGRREAPYGEREVDSDSEAGTRK
jgi:hypothetical protein